MKKHKSKVKKKKKKKRLKTVSYVDHPEANFCLFSVMNDSCYMCFGVRLSQVVIELKVLNECVGNRNSLWEKECLTVSLIEASRCLRFVFIVAMFELYQHEVLRSKYL